MAKKQTKVAIEDVLVIGEDDLKDKIHLIRGQKVMLDADLAEIYGYETKAFNRQVKNNIEKFEGGRLYVSSFSVRIVYLFKVQKLHLEQWARE